MVVSLDASVTVVADMEGTERYWEIWSGLDDALEEEVDTVPKEEDEVGESDTVEAAVKEASGTAVEGGITADG